MVVPIAAHPLPILTNGFTPAPTSSPNVSRSAVFPPVGQADAAAATGALGLPSGSSSQARGGGKSGDGQELERAGPGSQSSAATPDSGVNDASNRVQATPGQSQGQGQGGHGSNAGGQDTAGQPRAPDGKPLDFAQRAEVQKLQARDREVRSHEAAHQSVGGRFAGAVSYTYERAPNGKLYAIGGEVPIEIVDDPNNPQKTIDRMRQVIAAALAPADPSSQDRSVASRATQIMLSAQRALSAQDFSKSRAVERAAPGAQGSGEASKDQTPSPQPASPNASSLRLYNDVAQLAGTPNLNSQSPGIAATA